MRIALLLGVLALLTAGTVGLQHYLSDQTTANADALRTAVAKDAAEHASATYHLEAQDAGKVTDIVESLREGYGKATPAELRHYIETLQWAQGSLPADSVYQAQISRDLAWCEHKLKTAR